MVQLRLLGRSAVLPSAGGSEHVLERKDAAMLTVLALEGPTVRSRLAGLLWADAQPAVARGNLRQRLFRLRVAVGHAIVQPGTTLRLLDDVALDIATLRDRLLADPNAGQGDLLAGHDYIDQEELSLWVDSARERWRHTRLELLAQIASSHESRREVAAALAYAQRMLADEPLLEHAYRRVMRLHYLRGDRAAAMHVYEQCRQVLGEELGMRPSPETADLARVIESSRAPSPLVARPHPVTTLRPPRMVGRDSEWRRLAVALGEARMVLVAGEAGIGKSRLITEALCFHGDGHAAVCAASPGDAHLSFALAGRIVHALAERFGTSMPDWARAELARVAPALGVAPAGNLAPLRLQQALTHAIAAWRRSGLGLLIIDDLHYGDEASLELLPSIAGALRDVGVGGLFAVRDGEVPPLLARWWADIDTSSMTRIELSSLSLEAVHDLLRSLAIPGLDADAWSGPLARHTGGNPLFVLETLIALLDADPQALAQVPVDLPAPNEIGALIERRLRRLSPSALKLARLAALAGSDFSVSFASQLLGQHPLDIADQWHELERADVIRGDAFAHDLIREAVLRTVPEAIARGLHSDIAQILDVRGASAMRIAHHWQAAREFTRAAAAFESAAQVLRAASHRDHEAAAWDAAIECHERAGDERAAFRARCMSVKSVLAARPLADADRLTERLLAEAQDDAERLEALLARATPLVVAHNRGADAEAVAREAIGLADRLHLPWSAIDATRALALALSQQQRAAEGAALLESKSDAVESGGSMPQRYGYWSDLAFVLNAARRRHDSTGAWQRAVDLAEAIGDRDEVVTCTGNLAVLSAYLGRVDVAYANAVRARRIQVELGHAGDIVAGVSAMNVASFALLLGHFDEAIGQFEAALACFRAGAGPTWVAGCEHNLASAWLQLGQIARARQALSAVAPEVAPATRARRKIVEARLARALGQPTPVLLREALALVGGLADDVQGALAELELSLELPPDQAAELCQRVRMRCGAQELLGAAMKARLFEVEALLRDGSTVDAATAAESILHDLADCRPIDSYWAGDLWTIYRALATAGHPDALTVLRDAAQWVHEVAVRHVPEPFRDTFLHRHAVNRLVLAMAARLDGSTAA